MHKKMLEHNRNTRKEKVLDHNGNTHKVEMHTQMEVLMHIRRKQSCRNPLREDLHGGCIFGFFGDNIRRRKTKNRKSFEFENMKSIRTRVGRVSLEKQSRNACTNNAGAQ